MSVAPAPSPRLVPHRLAAFAMAIATLAALTGSPSSFAQACKDSVVLAMVLEPAPGLDPTVAPAAAIGEVVHSSVFEAALAPASTSSGLSA